MKIFFVTTSSQIESVLKTFTEDGILSNSDSFEIINKKLNEWGFASLFGLHDEYMFCDKCEINIFTNVANSEYIQKKWAKENNFVFSENWEKEILYEQIKTFQPDVIYTGNYSYVNKELKEKFPEVKVFAIWNASPLPKDLDLSYFDIGLSYCDIYLNHLKKRGVKNLERNDFYINTKIKNRVNRSEKDVDICFVGRHAPMFKNRNKQLREIYKNFISKNTIKFHLLLTKRFKNKITIFPLGLFRAYQKPIYINKMYELFGKTKIVFNSHSDISENYKGNMRVFEALASGSFMLSDSGVYPEHLKDGRDFIGYKDTNDLMAKIDYYLKNDIEREKIAANGYKTASLYYSTKAGSHNLKKIFEKYF